MASYWRREVRIKKMEARMFPYSNSMLWGSKLLESQVRSCTVTALSCSDVWTDGMAGTSDNSDRSLYDTPTIFVCFVLDRSHES